MQNTENKENPKRYRIATLDDFRQVPVDRLSACLADVHAIILTAKAAGNDTSVVSIRQVEWIDDGRDDATFFINAEVKNEQ